MKTWWLNASTRDKQFASGGAILLGLLVFYLLLLAPLQHKVSTLRISIARDRGLLSWMEASNREIQALEKKATSSNVNSSTTLLSYIQQDISAEPIGPNVSQLEQSEDDSIQLRFQQVSFDNLIKWLIKASTNRGILITQFQAQSSATAGIVSADLRLQGG